MTTRGEGGAYLGYTLRPTVGQPPIISDGHLQERILRIVAGTLLLAGISCGWFDQPPPESPTVDVTGTWVGPIDSTTPRGDPVYGTYTATFRLVQSGAAVTGSYSSAIGIGGKLNTGVVAGNRLALSISTTECAGTLSVSGIVTASPSSGPAEMDMVLSGKTACAGEREERGTLVRSTP